jgi:REP element-mobilizing transposase RayT
MERSPSICTEVSPSDYLRQDQTRQGNHAEKLCAYKEIEILEAEACKDHIHMLLSIPPQYSISQVMGYLKKAKAIC